MTRVVILTGGNIGDVKTRLQSSQRLINERVGAVLHCSHRYETQPWGFVADNESLFSNQVLEVSTDLSAEQVLDALQQIECELGRDRETESRDRMRTGAPYSSRTIDLDILFYGDEVISTPRLSIPHPLLAEREFVLQPLCEILRSKRHPVTGKTAGEMLEELQQRDENTRN